MIFLYFICFSYNALWKSLSCESICVMYLVQKVYALYKIHKLNIDLIHKLNIDLNKAGINLKDVARYENEKANYNVEKSKL